MTELFNRMTAIQIFLAAGVIITVEGFGLPTVYGWIAGAGFASLIDAGVRCGRLSQRGVRAFWSADDGGQLLYMPVWLAAWMLLIVVQLALRP